MGLGVARGGAFVATGEGVGVGGYVGIIRTVDSGSSILRNASFGRGFIGLASCPAVTAVKRKTRETTKPIRVFKLKTSTPFVAGM